ncbi:MAG: lyase family protein [Roseobacter sp.]|jgi:3-carboxy-cis,cis-muconate cycloisomerase|nr:lyase family protein [Roseobacter sp.]
MAASVFDSPLYASLFPTGDTGRLFSDSAALRAMLLVEGALAKAQGQLGIIPEISAAAIQRASLEIQIDPGALARSTGANGVCVPGLVDAFRSEMNAPEHAQYMHWGATSQDIIDSGLMLRLRQALALAEADLRTIATRLADEAERGAEIPMIARTYGQSAAPTSWGAVLAQWGNPLLDARAALPALRRDSLWVALGGAAGTGSALGGDPAVLRQALAEGLGLHDPGRAWHTDRGPVLRITDWMAQVAATLGGMGGTLVALASSGVQEVSFGATGASSTMPQKQNPVAASSLVALGHQAASLRGGLSTAAQHQHQRDGAAWFTEWMLVPQMALTLASGLHIAKTLTETLRPRPGRMAAALQADMGLVHAEALSFALAAHMPRPQAQALTKELCAKAAAQGTPLASVARAAVTATLPDDLFEASAQLGEAPRIARDFAARVRAL